MQCNFNITKYAPRQSCCLIIQNDGKSNFDKWDLQNALGMSESRIYKLKDQGSKQASCIMLLSRVLDKLREKNIEYTVENPSKIANFISNSNLRLKELNAKINDVLLIKNNKDLIKSFIEQAGYEHSIEDLLGTTQPLP